MTKAQELKKKAQGLLKKAEAEEQKEKLKLVDISISFLSGKIQKNEFFTKAQELGFEVSNV